MTWDGFEGEGSRAAGGGQQRGMGQVVVQRGHEGEDVA